MPPPPICKSTTVPEPRDAPRAGPSTMKVPTVAEHLEVSQRHVRRLIDGGQLPVHRIGRAVRVAEDDLIRFLRRIRR